MINTTKPQKPHSLYTNTHQHWHQSHLYQQWQPLSQSVDLGAIRFQNTAGTLSLEFIVIYEIILFAPI